MSGKRSLAAFALSATIAWAMIVYAPKVGIILPPLTEMGLLAPVIGFVAGVIGILPFMFVELVEALTE